MNAVNERNTCNEKEEGLHPLAFIPANVRLSVSLDRGKRSGQRNEPMKAEVCLPAVCNMSESKDKDHEARTQGSGREEWVEGRELLGISEFDFIPR
jgi:hypothetical protein